MNQSRAEALQALIVDDTAIQDEILAGLLRDRIQLTASGGIIFTSASSGLNVRSRALIGLLGAAALARLNKRPQTAITPKELEILIGIPGGTLRPALRELVSRRLIRATKGRYDVPPYAIEAVRQVLS